MKLQSNIQESGAATGEAEQSRAATGGGELYRRRIRIAASVAAALVFVSGRYFQNSRPGWNVNSQFALTLAIVERGTLSIDAYHAAPETETGDKAYFEGRFYSDKSPVTAFLGIPPFAAYRWIARAAGREVSYSAARYWTTWFTIGGSAAALAAMLTVLLARRGVEPEWAASLAALWMAATPLFGYSILFFNYLPACAMAMGGYILAEPWIDASKPGGGRRLFAGGALVGLAAWTLPTMALWAIVLTAAMIVATRSRAPALWPWALGGALGVCGYAIYSLALFDEIASPYKYEFDANFRREMARGLMGAGWPDPRVLWLITFHPYRGLFTLFPATLLAMLGLVWTIARSSRRAPALAALAFLAGMLLYNAGYYMWWGGWAYAPRHLIPAVAPLALGLAPWARSRPMRREEHGAQRANPRAPSAVSSSPRNPLTLYFLLFVLAAGALVNVAAVSLDPQFPPLLPDEQLLDPETVREWPSPFVESLRYVLRGQTDANWGVKIGLSGPASLAPLCLLWMASLSALTYAGRKRETIYS